jgi:hypothetical protein
MGVFDFQGGIPSHILQHSVGVRFGWTTPYMISYGHCFDLYFRFSSGCIAWTVLGARACSTVFMFSFWVALIKPSRWAVEGGSSTIFTGWNYGCTRRREDGHFQQHVDSALVPLQGCNEATCITIAVTYIGVRYLSVNIASKDET